VYYGFIQNLIFSALQSALGAMIGADADDDEEKIKGYERTVNSMIDGIRGGLGFGGQAVITVKNSIQEYLKQEDKGWSADHGYTLLKLVSFSPTIGSKLRKIYSAIKGKKYNEDIMKEMDLLDIDNPTWAVTANVISGVFNIPLDRVVKKVDNIDAVITEDISFAQKLALLFGWSTWDLGIEDQDIIKLEEEIKERKKEDKKIETKEKEEKKKEIEDKVLEEKFETEQKKEREEGVKDIKCIGVNKRGERCGVTVEGDGKYCTIHQPVEKREDGKRVQCKKIKSNKKRCKMKTSASSGLCYYHD
jgi:hypothetical protein